MGKRTIMVMTDGKPNSVDNATKQCELQAVIVSNNNKKKPLT